MDYERFVERNHLTGDYDSGVEQGSIGGIAGDLRRLEADQVDEEHLAQYAEYARITVPQAWLVLKAFFEGRF